VTLVWEEHPYETLFEGYYWCWTVFSVYGLSWSCMLITLVSHHSRFVISSSLSVTFTHTNTDKLSRVWSVNVDGGWIGNWICWTLTDPWLNSVVLVRKRTIPTERPPLSVK
jgi:hypothetical protein